MALVVDIARWPDTADLSAYDLRAATFFGSAPSPLDLSGCDLTGAVFHDADLGVGANLTDCLLDGAVFLRTRARGVRLDGASLSRAEIHDSRMPHASFIDIGAQRIVIHQSDLSSSVFSEADLQWAVLDGAVLKQVLLHLVDLSFADLRGVIWNGVEFDGLTMVESNLSGLDLRGFDLSGILLGDANLAGAQLQGASLEDSTLHFADLSDADLRGARLAGADFWRADLTRADLRSTDLSRTTFKRSRLVQVDFSDARTAGLVAKQCDVEGARAVPRAMADTALRSDRLLERSADEDEFVDDRLDAVDADIAEFELEDDQEEIDAGEAAALRLYADRHARASIGRELLNRVPHDDVWDWCDLFISNMGGWYPVPSVLWDRYPYLHLIEAIETEEHLLLFVRDAPEVVVDTLRDTMIGGDFDRDDWLPQEPTVIFDAEGQDYEVQVLWTIPLKHHLLAGDSIRGRMAMRQMPTRLDGQPPHISLDDRDLFLHAVGGGLPRAKDLVPWTDERIADVLRLGSR